MAKELNLDEIPQAISMDGLEEPVKEAPEKKAPAAKEQTAAKAQAPAGDGKKKEYDIPQALIDDLNYRFPKPVRDSIKQELGVDIDKLIENKQRFILEAFNRGDYSDPVKCRNHSGDVSLRIYPTRNNDRGWDYRIIPVNPEKIKKGEILKFRDQELTPQQSEEIRLTGHINGCYSQLEKVKNTEKTEYEKTDLLLGSNKYNPHELCEIKCSVAKDRMLGYQWAKDDKGFTISLKPTGCMRYEDNPVVHVELEINHYDKATKKFTPVKSAVTGSNIVRIPVNAAAEIKLSFPDGEHKLSLSANRVQNLAPSIEFEKNNDKVITFLSARQVASASYGDEIWGGTSNSMSFIKNGADGQAWTPVEDKSHAMCFHFDPFKGKLTTAVSYKMALRNELENENKQSRETAMARTEAENISVNQHI